MFSETNAKWIMRMPHWCFFNSKDGIDNYGQKRDYSKERVAGSDR